MRLPMIIKPIVVLKAMTEVHSKRRRLAWHTLFRITHKNTLQKLFSFEHVSAFFFVVVVLIIIIVVVDVAAATVSHRRGT